MRHMVAAALLLRAGNTEPSRPAFGVRACRAGGGVLFHAMCSPRGILQFLILLVATRPALGHGVSDCVLEAENARIAVIDRVKDAAVAIFATDGGGGGSGVCVSADGYVVTNFHVVQPCGPAMRCGLADGQLYDAVIVGVDPAGDLAMIKMLGRDDFPAAVLGDSDKVRVGDEALVLGNPFMLANTLYPTVTWGIISGVNRYQYPAGTILEYADCLQTDASINPGNSGGPLYNAAGEVIGINGRCSFEKRGRINVGVGWAISSNQVKNFLGDLRSGRVVDHATAGFTVTTDNRRRVVVSDLLETSDAYRRGLRYDDEIIAFGGRAIDTANTFKNVLGILPAGWRVPLSFRRQGERRDVLIRLRGLHSEAELLEAMRLGMPRPIPIEPSEEPPGQRSDVSKAKQTLPDAVQPFYESRPGYANYYFNRVERDRALERWVRTMSSRGPGEWTLSGPIEGGGEFRFVIADESITYELPAEQGVWQAGRNLSGDLAPAGSGGLLPALWMWRRLACVPPHMLGDVYYQGTAPWPGVALPTDVVVAVAHGVTCRFYFDVPTGRLLAMELYTDDATDPCEIEWLDVLESETGQTSRLRIRHGNVTLATLTVGD